MKKKLAIMGSTGSIGKQSLEVVDAFPDMLEVFALSAHSNTDLLSEQAIKYNARFAIIADESKYQDLKEKLSGKDITPLAGPDSLKDIVAMEEVDLVIAAIVGFAGLISTYNAVLHGKTIALANKETLVVAGDMIMEKAKLTGADIIPVDSEHSAIFQCLQGEQNKNIEKLILTASGGPFRKHSNEELKKVTKSQALKHPNWEMGAKITIDSASLMNKGLEMIEARWLFDVDPSQIDVVVHPQSIVHSFVQFDDGSLKAQCGLPDMKLPIQYAIMYPDRAQNDFQRFDFRDFPIWNFEEPRWEDFDCIRIARDAMDTGGIYPAVLNAANEVAVDLFLKEKISFLEIPMIIRKTLENFTPRQALSIEDYMEIDEQARNITYNY